MYLIELQGTVHQLSKLTFSSTRYMVESRKRLVLLKELYHKGLATFWNICSINKKRLLIINTIF